MQQPLVPQGRFVARATDGVWTTTRVNGRMLRTKRPGTVPLFHVQGQAGVTVTLVPRVLQARIVEKEIGGVLMMDNVNGPTRRTGLNAIARDCEAYIMTY
jgi:hypothetical protein